MLFYERRTMHVEIIGSDAGHSGGGMHSASHQKQAALVHSRSRAIRKAEESEKRARLVQRSLAVCPSTTLLAPV
jgi:hypothetical protein